jgi:hypothetical protein
MKHGDLEPLSAEMKRLLAKERYFPAERQELRARTMARARTTLDAVSAPAARSFWQRRVTLLVAAALVLGFAAAAIAARQGLLRAALQPPSVPTAVVVTHPDRAHDVEPASPSAEVPLATPDEMVPDARDRGNVGTTPRESPAADVSDLDALELRLLQRARGAIAKGDFSSALETIAEHQRRFPAGRLREEREALRIKALAGLGRNDEARRAAEAFRERFPRSVLKARIEETVRPNP